MTAPTITRRRCADDQPHDPHHYRRGLNPHYCGGMAAPAPKAPQLDWMEADEVADYLGMGTTTVHRHVREGRLKAHLDFRGSRRFLRTDVEQFAQERGL